MAAGRQSDDMSLRTLGSAADDVHDQAARVRHPYSVVTGRRGRRALVLGVWLALVALTAAHGAGMSVADGLPFGGEVRFEADALWFTDSASGLRYVLAGEAAFADLERTYRDTVDAPGAPLYLTFDGAIVTGDQTGQAGRGPSLVVHRFIHAWPHQGCERALADAELTHTYWRIVRIGGAPVRADWGRREPHLILRGEGPAGHYVATLGCNPLVGDYALDAQLIRLRPAASVPADCPSPLAPLEPALEQALTEARRWRIKASTLELFDSAGRPVALFEAVYF